MKKSLNFGMLIMLSFSLMSAMCSSDDETNQNGNAAEIQQVVAQVQDGNWKITYYFDSDQEETTDYVNYSFKFEANNILTVIDESSNTIVGSWSVTDTSNSSDDSSGDDDIDFNISFTTPPKFEELSDDWDITTHNNTKIELVDISGGNGGTDYLTFEKEQVLVNLISRLIN